jgi:type II restriction enzyme
MATVNTLLDQARDILRQLGMPERQQNKMSSLTLLALCRMTVSTSWTSARSESLTIRKGIMDYISTEFEVKYAENSRESFRRQVLHQFVQAGLVLQNPDDPSLPTNSSKNHYRISDEALAAIRKFSTRGWTAARDVFLRDVGALSIKYAARRNQVMVPLKVSEGQVLYLSPGRHNEVQSAVVHEFGPRFAPGASLIYLGDTAEKGLHVDSEALGSLGFEITAHDKMPDVVLFDSNRNWLFLIEAVTSHGPMSPKRVIELQKTLANCAAGLIFVSAFPDIKEFKKHADNIAWDTEVWLADTPDHLMHFNGDRFLGPR